MENFFNAWQFLNEHPIFYDNYKISHFLLTLDIEVVKVNPETLEIDDDKSKNTKVNVWLECGPYDKELEMSSHDYDLDCGADTFEEAIVELAALVKEKYGGYSDV